MELFTSQLVLIQVGGFSTKIKSLLFLSAIFSPIPFLIERISCWTVSNSNYVSFVLGAIMIDHILGTFLHAFKLKDFSFKKNLYGVMIKTGLVLAIGFLFEGISTIVTGRSVVKDYLTIVMRLLVFLYPASSALINSSIITNGKFPPYGFISKLKKFQDNANLKELTKE